MTSNDITKLCDHLRLVLTRKITIDKMSDEQLMFWNAFEDSAFGADLLTSYSDLAHHCPETSLRLLHCFILGHAMGSRHGKKYVIKHNPKKSQMN